MCQTAYTEVAMPYIDLKKGVHRTVMTLGMAFILIGVVLLTVSDKVFILGICFLGVGSLAVIGYLLVTVSACVKKKRRREDEENPTEGDNRQATQRQVEAGTSQFDAPSYDEVILYGSGRVWTVSIGPPLPDMEPPPYQSALAHRRGAIADLRIPNPVLLRVSSDIHELKRSGFMQEERWIEPLTPPPTYNETINHFEEDDDFEPTREEG
ncbi:transmembrane protein 139 [Gastrophryne carolinensis]